MAAPTLTQHAPGTFCWPELATSDPAAATTFYSGLFGWTLFEAPTDVGPYYMFRLGGDDVGASYKMRADEGQPHWNSYVSVASADEAAARAQTLGATVVVQPFDVFDAGRMAVLRDPAGAFFCVWQAKAHIGARRLNEPGTLCWTELATTDTAAAERFYTGLFGWRLKKGTAAPGEYTEIYNREQPIGGIMQIQPEWGEVPPHWMPYFAVVDCDASAGRAKDLGAKLLVRPTDIPGVGRFAVIEDSQGAAFAIIALREAA
jgi:hypothetical protein